MEKSDNKAPSSAANASTASAANAPATDAKKDKSKSKSSVVRFEGPIYDALEKHLASLTPAQSVTTFVYGLTAKAIGFDLAKQPVKARRKKFSGTPEEIANLKKAAKIGDAQKKRALMAGMQAAMEANDFSAAKPFQDIAVALSAPNITLETVTELRGKLDDLLGVKRAEETEPAK